MMTAASMTLPSVLLLVALPLSAASPGKVTEVPEPCPAGPLVRTSRKQLLVAVPNLKDLRVQLRITQPAPEVPLRGTVVLGSGGSGAGFYAGPPPVQALVKELSDMGFLVVDRNWIGGWPTMEGGLKPEAARYATLLRWVHDSLHKGGRFVATGNSGGSAEIGYALTTYGLADILDTAIPTSGPPVARLDYTCTAEASPAWSELCSSIVPTGAMQCKPGCMLGPGNGVCRQTGPRPPPEQLLNDSVVHPEAVLSYPKTRLVFLFGALDCDEPVPSGLTWATRVKTEKRIEFVPNTPHAIMSTPEGRAAIRRVIDEATR